MSSTKRANAPTQLEHEAVLTELLHSGHLSAESKRHLSLSCKNIRDCIKYNLPYSNRYRLRDEGRPAPVLEVEALRTAFGSHRVRSVWADAAFIPALPLFSQLKILHLSPDQRMERDAVMSVVPLSATGLKTLKVTSPRSSPSRVLGLSALTALSSLYLSAVQPSSDQLPDSITELTLADFDVFSNVFMDARTILNKFGGQLHTLSLGATAFKAFTSNMAQLSAVPCLEHLTHLALSLSEVRATTPAVTQACFLGLQTLNLRICNPILPCWDFSLCPKLENLHLHLSLLLSSHPTVDLRRLTGMRAKHLNLQIECQPNLHILVNVAGWELESASVMLSHADGPVPQCRDSMIGRELLGALYLEVPQDKVAG